MREKIPHNIEREHIIKSIEVIDHQRYPSKNKSTGFDLIYKGKQYPPKYVISMANKYANGKVLDVSKFSGGEEANNKLRALGFEIAPKNQNNPRYPIYSYSWKLVSNAVALKKTDKTIFIHNETGIPSEIRHFFDIDDMKKGEKRSITLIFHNHDYSANIEMTVNVPPRSRLIWKTDFNSIIEGKFPKWLGYFQEEGESSEDTPVMRFEKTSEKNTYKIEFISDENENGPSLFINSLKTGEIIDNEELCRIFGCKYQGGMRRSLKTNTLVLVSDHTKAIYEDKWIDDTFHFTGMGRSGDQSLNFDQNETLNESRENGVHVHLFEVFEKGKFVYMGEVNRSGEPYPEIQLDKDKKPRRVYIFPLKIKSDQNKPLIREEIIQRKEEEQRKKARRFDDDSELEKMARFSRKFVGRREVMTTRYERDQYVAEYAKRRAKGICQLCGEPAPFEDKNDSPYLETHHIEWLSNGGEDSIENTVALCPNCHKKMHILDLDEDRVILISKTRV